MTYNYQDLDEFIVPYKHDNLGKLLNKLDDKKAASFTVQNAFFYLYWDNATEVAPNLPKGAGSFHIHRKTMKELGILALLGIRERPNLAQNLVTH